jgi:hypothetical protein
MKTFPLPDSLVLRSPDAVVAALPYLVGFTPQHSLVALWIEAGRVLLTQRLDLAGWPLDPVAWQTALWGHPSAAVADEVVVVTATDEDLPSDLVAAVRTRAAGNGVVLKDFLVVHDGRWCSALCRDTHCCPPGGRSVDPRVAAEVAAEFTVTGAAPVRDRQMLVDSMARDEDAAEHTVALLEGVRPPDASSRDALEAWRDEAVASVLAGISRGGLTPDSVDSITTDTRDTALALTALTDIRVRDTVLWHVSAFDPPELHQALVQLTCMLRAAPEEVVAPVATTCAVVAWLLGDGARAAIAVDRALRASPDYSLALLVAHSLSAGLPPGSWRSAMASVTREECRYGQGATRRRAG